VFLGEPKACEQLKISAGLVIEHGMAGYKLKLMVNSCLGQDCGPHNDIENARGGCKFSQVQPEGDLIRYGGCLHNNADLF
jgi:hypothetical protein